MIRKVEISQKKWIASMVGCALMGSALGSVGLSFADNLRSTSNLLDSGVVLPYEGYLMLDSAPVNKSDQQVRFSLYESASGGTAQWVEGQTVSVVNGKFAVALGSDVNNKVSSSPANATFSDVILDAQKLYIGIEVMNDQGQFIELSGRQEIQPAPYAAWSARSADFKAEGDMVIEGVTRPQNGVVMRDDTSISGVDQIIGHNDLRLSGSPTNSNDLVIDAGGHVALRRGLDVQGTITSQGSISSRGSVAALGTISTQSAVTASGTVSGQALKGAYLPEYQNWDSVGTGAGGAAIYNDSGNYKSLMVVGNRATGGSSREIDLYDNVTVNNRLSVGGDMAISGNLTGGLKYTSEYLVSVNGTADLVPSYNAFCFLTELYWDHHFDDIRPLGCKVYVSNGMWKLTNTESTVGANFGDMTCRARCLVGPVPQ